MSDGRFLDKRISHTDKLPDSLGASPLKAYRGMDPESESLRNISPCNYSKIINPPRLPQVRSDG